jgi:hypothetical protein
VLRLIPLTSAEREEYQKKELQWGWWNQLFELLAVWFALKSFVRGRTVQLWIDNMTALKYVRDGGGPCAVKSAVACEIIRWNAVNDITVWAPEFVGTKENWADVPSRIVDPGDWRVVDWLFLLCEGWWGPHSVDRFADWDNAKLPRFNSKWWCPQTEAVNTYSQQWGGENNWVVPPFGEIFNVAVHIMECEAKATLVVPRWTGQVWWPILQRLSEEIWEIPEGGKAFFRGPSGKVEPWVNPAWRFVVMRVDGRKGR